MSIWVCGGLVKLDFFIHKTLCYDLLWFTTMTGWCSGQHSCFSCWRLGFNSPYEPTYFQKPFFSISSFWDHQTFLYKTSKLRNPLPSKCREGRVISHIKGLPQKLTYYYRAIIERNKILTTCFLKWTDFSCPKKYCIAYCLLSEVLHVHRISADI